MGVKIKFSARGTRVLYSLLAGSVWGKGGREDRIQCTWYSYSVLTACWECPVHVVLVFCTHCLLGVCGGKVGMKIESSAHGTRVLYSLLAGSVWGKGGRGEDRIFIFVSS